MATSRVPSPCEKVPDRHLVLIDIENIAGCPCPTAVEVSAAHAEMRHVVPEFDAGQLVVACNHRAAATVSFEFPNALRLWRSGPDGADLALIDQMRDLRVMRRFGRITLCSGDGIFAETVAALASAGIQTTVVSWADRLSRRLRLAAHGIVMLPTPSQEVA